MYESDIVKREILLNWSKNKIERYKNRGGKIFLELPEEWFEKWTIACENGHVSTCVLKTVRGSVCLKCGKDCITLVPPNTSERFLRSLIEGKKLRKII